ncbi:MAG: hypothetical protein H0T53_16300 [Herpetosiphonaceae bacterium]|nr:hypothetical protein [Herpetosiphonaceae bacterium]
MIGHEDADEAIDTIPSFKNWPPTISDLLEEADSVRYLLDSDRTAFPHSDRIDPREAGVLIDLVRHGVRCLVQTMVTLDAIATWNPQPGLVVWPNPLTCRERVDQRLASDQWHATLSPLANVVIARKALWNEEAATLRRIAEAMAQQLGAAAKELDTVVRDRWDAPATRVAEHVLASFRHMERAERPGPAPLAPIAPWSEDWWIIVPGGPASTQTIRDYAQRQKHELELALKQLTRSRSTTLHAATTAPMLALGAAGIDAIRRLRVFQHVLLFVIERTIEEWPIITPVPIDEGIPWAISGERLPLLEEQRAVLAATTPTPATMLTFLTHVAATLDEMLLDLRYVEQMELGNQIEGMSDVDEAVK